MLLARGGAFGIVQTASTQLTIVVINLVAGIIVARWLGPSGRGAYAALAVWLMLPACLSLAGLQAGVIVVARRQPEAADAVALAGLLCGAFVFAIVAAPSLFLAPWFVQDYGIGRLTSVAILASGVNMGVMLSRQSLLGRRQTMLFNLSCAASPTLYLTALAACSLSGHTTFDAVFFSQIAAIAVAGLFAIAFYVRRQAGAWGIRRVLRPLASYSVRASGIDLINIVYGNADRLFLIAAVGSAELGLYAVALSFARLISIVQVAVSSVLLVDIAGKPASEIESYVHALFAVLFWVLAISCLLAFAFGRFALDLFFGPAFALAAPIFDILVVETSLSCLSQIIVEAFLASEQPSYPSKVQVAYALVLLAALAVLTPRFGGLGAASAMLLAAFCKMGMLLTGLRRIAVALPHVGPIGIDRARHLRRLLAR